jgi:hypothetical protein
MLETNRDEKHISYTGAGMSCSRDELYARDE